MGGLAPVNWIANDLDPVAPNPAREAKRAGSHRIRLVSVGALRRNDYRVSPAHREGEVAGGSLEGHQNGVGSDRRNRIDGLEKSLLRVRGVLCPCALQREDHVLGVEVRTVVEPHARSQGERVRQSVVADRPGFREPRQHRNVRSNAGQALENVGVDDLVDRRRGACGRIEVRRFEANPDRYGPAVGARCAGEYGNCHCEGGEQAE